MPHIALAPSSDVRTFCYYGCFKTEPGGRTRVCGTSGFTAALVVLRPLRTTCACWALLVLPVCINASAVVSLKFRSHIHADGARKCYNCTHKLRETRGESCACPSTATQRIVKADAANAKPRAMLLVHATMQLHTMSHINVTSHARLHVSSTV